MTFNNDDLGSKPLNDPNKGERKLSSFALLPSSWIMISAVVLTILLNLFCGLKIMNLESERNQLQLEKISVDERARSLESDIAAHAKLLQELPELKTQHADLSAKVAGLEGKLSDLTNRETALLQNVTNLQNDLETAVADRKQTEAATKAAREETGRLQSDISGLKSEESTLSLNIAKTRQDVARQEAQVSKLMAQSQSLEAEIAALVKTKEARLSEMETLTKDNSRLMTLGAHFKDLADNMEASRMKAEEASGALSRSAEAAQQTLADLASHSKAAADTVKELRTSGENVNRLAAEFGKDRSDAGAAVSELARAASEAKTQTQRLTAQIDGPMNTLKGDTEALGNLIQGLGSKMDVMTISQKDLGESAKRFNTFGEQIETLQTQLATKLADLENQAGQLGRAIAFIDKDTQTLQGYTRKLETEHQGIAKSASTLDAQTVAAEKALQELTAFTTRLSPNVSSVEGASQELKNSATELKTTLTETKMALEDIRKLREEASSAFLLNGANLKKVLEDMVRDATSLEEEIRMQLKTVQEQTTQSPTLGAETGNPS